jgi:hypothetical protein
LLYYNYNSSSPDSYSVDDVVDEFVALDEVFVVFDEVLFVLDEVFVVLVVFVELDDADACTAVTLT